MSLGLPESFFHFCAVTLTSLNAKLVEWHVDYGVVGFTDSIGCGIGGAAFPVSPFGETEEHDLVDANGSVIGFELVQDLSLIHI